MTPNLSQFKLSGSSDLIRVTINMGSVVLQSIIDKKDCDLLLLIHHIIIHTHQMNVSEYAYYMSPHNNNHI